jgi:hypothetical protein
LSFLASVIGLCGAASSTITILKVVKDKWKLVIYDLALVVNLCCMEYCKTLITILSHAVESGQSFAAKINGRKILDQIRYQVDQIRYQVDQIRYYMEHLYLTCFWCAYITCMYLG